MELNKIIHGDCLEYMKTVPDNYFDLVLTDPPYGIGADVGFGGGSHRGVAKKFKGDWDSSAPSKKVFDEIVRISRHQIIFGANHFISKIPYDSPSWIVWDKDNGTTNFADSELAWTSHKTAVRNFKWTWNGMIQEAGGKKEYREHPTQKPVELMAWCLENYLVRKWDKDRKPRVFDGFAGSGTTGVACKKCGCDYVLVEKEKDYCDVIEKRLKQETLF